MFCARMHHRVGRQQDSARVVIVNIGGATLFGRHNSDMRDFSQVSSATIKAKALYSASVEDMETRGCF